MRQVEFVMKLCMNKFSRKYVCISVQQQTHYQLVELQPVAFSRFPLFLILYLADIVYATARAYAYTLAAMKSERSDDFIFRTLGVNVYR